MDRDIEGRATAEYLWDVKKVVPILKWTRAWPLSRTAPR